MMQQGPELANNREKGYNGIWKEIYDENVFDTRSSTTSSGNFYGKTDRKQLAGILDERNAADKIGLLDDFIKENHIDNLALTSEEILKVTYGDVQLAKNVIIATKEVVPGKTVLELVDIFKIPDDPKSGSLSSYQTRIWYKWRESMFDWRLDYNKPLKEVARAAFNMRNEARSKARELMLDRVLAEALMKNDRNWTFDDFVQYKIAKKNVFDEDLWKDIIESATKSREDVDRLFGLIWG
ncbi:hypothetical protein AAFA46_00835 [Oscillospiraceae bacterium WX1]